MVGPLDATTAPIHLFFSLGKVMIEAGFSQAGSMRKLCQRSTAVSQTLKDFEETEGKALFAGVQDFVVAQQAREEFGS
jgi:hypothetical protein